MDTFQFFQFLNLAIKFLASQMSSETPEKILNSFSEFTFQVTNVIANPLSLSLKRHQRGKCLMKEHGKI